MALTPGYQRNEAQLTMMLSALAYTDETPRINETIEQQEQRMRADLNAALSARAPGWQVAWGPMLNPDRSNMMYVAGNSSERQYVVAIRGTDWTFVLDWIEDFASLLPLVSYANTPKDPGIKIALGTSIGLQVLLDMGIIPFVKTTSPDAGIYVTGHSLGGCLASVLAPVIATALGGTDRIKVYTFAAPSAGNSSFADYYNNLFAVGAQPQPQSRAFRVYDTLDVVPNAWASLDVIETYYQGFVSCPADIERIVDLAQSAVGNEYSQVGAAGNDSAYPLTGKIVWPFAATAAGIDPIGDALFLWQAAQQHSVLNYISLLGAQATIADVAKVKGMLARQATLRRGTTA